MFDQVQNNLSSGEEEKQEEEEEEEEEPEEEYGILCAASTNGSKTEKKRKETYKKTKKRKKKRESVKSKTQEGSEAKLENELTCVSQLRQMPILQNERGKRMFVTQLDHNFFIGRGMCFCSRSWRRAFNLRKFQMAEEDRSDLFGTTKRKKQKNKKEKSRLSNLDFNGCFIKT